MNKHLNHRSPWIWIISGFLSLSLIAMLGVMLIIGWKGLSFFWPSPVYQFEIKTNKGPDSFLGEIYDSNLVSSGQLIEAGVVLADVKQKEQYRYLIKIANRDKEKHDFISILEQDIVLMKKNPDIAIVKRYENGDFFGFLQGAYIEGAHYKISPQSRDYQLILKQFRAKQAKLNQASRNIKTLYQKLESLKNKLKINKESQNNELLQKQINLLSLQYKKLKNEQIQKENQLAQDSLIVQDRQGKISLLPLEQVIELCYPNKMTFSDKLIHWASHVAFFVKNEPHDVNGEGGVFPAIFGTVLMVLLMAIIVTPLGVLAAIYLHEYAKKNIITRLIRIALVNLAGVPSIVYGVFGLGFFVYFIGGNIDSLFYSDALPSPTFGTPGLLWSSLTLAILTLPVVIVSTEEGLSRIPLAVRHGSMALGATQAETLWRIILPMASPAIMTGLILAIARAAGEVAPLMLVGVVKVAPSLALDGHFPYLHLDRKFMHLGYHIYDIGFQSPNIEAARPLVYAISLLLVLVIISLNLVAVTIRYHLREKYRVLEQQM